MDYNRFVDITDQKIRETGRAVTLYKLDNTPVDSTKPWRGPASTPAKIASYSTFGLFMIPHTSIPTESRGLAMDWIDVDLLKRSKRVCLIPAKGAPDLQPYSLLSDGGSDFVLIWGQAFKPGPTLIFYVFGLAE
jgi:hypothetical protein